MTNLAVASSGEFSGAERTVDADPDVQVVSAGRPGGPGEPCNGPSLKVIEISVTNFRLLKDVQLALSPESTVLVGRNNTGKTSLADVLVKFLQSGSCQFSIADFSAEAYDAFRDAYMCYRKGDLDAARAVLPSVMVTIDIDYGDAQSEYGPLAALIVDLDEECTLARVRFEYSLVGGRLADLFDGIEKKVDASGEVDLTTLIAHITDRIPAMYERSITAVDPGDPSNTRAVRLDSVQRLITVDFLQAQRGLDDDKERPKDLIGQSFHALFMAAAASAEDTSQRQTAERLAEAIADIAVELGEKVEQVMSDVVPALERFGYPGLSGQKLATSTKLDVERLLADYTSVHYEGFAGVTLPESYSGLGSRNLVLILLTLLSYYRAQVARGAPSVHLVFIEEPEAHLHPQMQEVFIDQLGHLCKLFPGIDDAANRWAAQFVISTHSSHVANKASFSAIRYFLAEPAAQAGLGRHAKILKLSSAPGIDEPFLHQYLTLTRSDLFFADKAILVEGTSERLIVPKAIEKCATGLSSQYVTLIEVGGAYAHLFFPLLDFLQIPSLVITDIDSVAKREGDTRAKAALVHAGEGTSNATIKHWFKQPNITPTQLLTKAASGEIIKRDRYLAFQVSEDVNGPCGRSFEEAFILANPEIFGLDMSNDLGRVEEESAALAGSEKKSDFALRFAVEQTAWRTPRYIDDGLKWLLSVNINGATAVVSDAGQLMVESGPVVVK